MAHKTQSMIFDCTGLPYSRIKGDKEGNATKKTERKAESFSPEQKSFKLRKLTGRPILLWPPVLPSIDCRGVQRGAKFECWKKARDGKTGLSSNSYNLKTGRTNVTHSFLETKLLAAFEICPYVIDCRTQYPSWNSEKYQRYIKEGRRIPTSFVMTIDFMLTLALPWIPYPVYHGVSGKPRAFHNDRPVVRRHQRECNSLENDEITHEIMDEYEVSDCEYKNHLLIRNWMLWTDIEACQIKSIVFADALSKSKIAGNLERLISIISKRQGFNINFGYSLFAIAVFLGHVVLNHKFPLHPQLPLYML